MKTITRVVLALLICSPITVFASLFDNNLNQIAKIRQNKNHQLVVTRLQNMNASPELEDLRLFLLAEALQALNKNAEAIEVYDYIINNYPNNETAYKSAFPHFMLNIANADKDMLPRLELWAGQLPTPWQKGTAFQKISELQFIGPAAKSRFALTSLREFNKNKPFYRNIEACHNLLKQILNAPNNWTFNDEQWLEILMLAANENLISELFRNRSPQNMLARFGSNALEVFRAEHLRQSGQQAQAINIFNTLINSPNQPIRTIAYQFRGDLFYHSQRYAEAIKDYEQVIQNPVFPTDVISAKYRLMRSAWELEKDAKSLQMINSLVKMSDDVGPLFPIHLFDMGLRYYDSNAMAQSVPYFMALAKHFPEHYRANAAIGYAAIAMGRNTPDALTLIQLLENKYPHSFYLYWLAPEKRNAPLKYSQPKLERPTDYFNKRFRAWEKIWNSDLKVFAREEARRFSDNYPANKTLYYNIIKAAKNANDYTQLTTYSERLLRQLIQKGSSPNQMPRWAWEAMYPIAYRDLVTKHSKEFNIDKFWTLSIMREESHFRPDALSRSNAMGPMQILPTTGEWIAGRLGVRGFRRNDLWNLQTNIRFGCWYLRFLLDLFDQDMYLSSAAYNAGQGNIQRRVEAGSYSHLPVLERLDKVPFPETRDYYKKVMGTWWNYKRIYNN